MSDFPIFTGNCPRNVSKDAKYSVRHDRKTGVLGVGLTYRTGEDERWHMTTIQHPDLVDMVNAVKLAHGGGANGPFYINEYKQVVVPVGDSAQYYLAGKYEAPLEFHFKGRTISGKPIGADGQRLQPGDTWHGPHAGIPYVLTAAGDDIYYRTRPEPEIEKRVRLSNKRGRVTAAQMARLLSAIKGPSGGRFYVNEFRCVFTPIDNGESLHYIYFGQIELDSWFPEECADALVSA
jgi:hypothetical protein